MLRSKVLLRTFFAAAIAAMLAATALGDTIRLKDGSIIKGKITGFSDGRFVVVIGEGERRRELTFIAGEVESVIFESQAAASRMASSTRPAANDSASAANPKVIISDTSTAQTEEPQPKVTRRSEPNTTATLPVQKASTARPVEVSVKVLADNSSNGWTNSGWVVRKGQKIRISGTGEVSLGNGVTSAPGGLYDIEDDTKLLKAVPTGALIAVIGDDNNEFIYIGTSREFIAARDGALFLGVNEGNLNDNSGSFDVKIEIAPDGE